MVADIRAGLPFAADSFDVIVSIHALPEIAYHHMDGVLSELYRILAPGGTLRISLPDMDKAIQAYLAKDVDYFFLIPDGASGTISGKMITQLLWYGQSRTLFTWDFIRELLQRNGFISINLCNFQQSTSRHHGITDLDDREIESLFVEGMKPETPTDY